MNYPGTFVGVSSHHFYSSPDERIRTYLDPFQPAIRRLKNVHKTSNFWSQKRLVLVRNGSRDHLFLRRRKDVL